MRKVLLLLVGLCFSLVSMAEARTYTNSKYGFAIDIPDYFVVRDNLGMFDFRADGGDDYGVDNILYHRDGIGVTVSSRSCEYESVDDAYMQDKVRGYIATAKKMGVEPTKFFYYNVAPNHKAIGSYRVDKFGNFVHVFMGIEVVMHGRTVNVSVEGTVNNAKEVGQIIESFRCLKH